MEAPQVLKIDSASPLLGMYLKKMKMLKKDACILMFTVALVATAKTWKQTSSPSTDDWITMQCVYTAEHY